MRGTVIGIESGTKYNDGKRRIAFRFEDADTGWKELRIPEDKLPTSMRGVQLDYEVEVTLEVARAPIPQHDVKQTNGCTCGDMYNPQQVDATCPIHGAYAAFPASALPDAHLEGCSCPNCTDVRAFGAA